MRFGFIEDHRSDYPVRPLDKMSNIDSRSEAGTQR
jgi:hypothetical protein